MKLAPINEYYSPSFGAVKSIGEYTEKQMNLDFELKNILKNPYKSIRNKTPANYYGSKGYDFLIQPVSTDRVQLSMCKDLKIIYDGIKRSYTCSEEINIGEHCDNAPLNVDDIKCTYNHHNGNKNTYIGLFSGLLIVLSMALGFSQYKGTRVASMQTIEKVSALTDSIYNKLASVFK